MAQKHRGGFTPSRREKEVDVHIDLKDRAVIGELEMYCKYVNKSRAEVVTIAVREYLEKQRFMILHAMSKDELVELLLSAFAEESEGE